MTASLGITTIAPLGEAEDGQAGIVGCVVASGHQRSGEGAYEKIAVAIA